MGIISFNSPWVLLLILPVMGFILWSFKRAHKSGSNKEKWAAVLRCLIAILLILSLGGISIRKYTDNATLVFAVDLSDSTKNAREDMAAFIREAIEDKPLKYQTGVVTFGKNSLVEQPLSPHMGFYGLETIPDPHYTDISGGLQMARALIPDDTQKRIVLLTDGNQNLGDAVQKARSLSQQGIRIDGVFFDTAPDADAQISSLDVPSKLYQNETYDIRVVVESTVNTSGIIRLYANRKPIGEQKVELQKGENRFIFKDKAHESGIKTYEAELDALGDTIRPNNRMASYVEVQGTPTIALLEGAEGEARELAAILEAGDIAYKIYNPQSFPEELDELRKYHAIALCNVSADDLGKARINILDTYVKSLGRGVLFTGGDNSYALGGYMGTPLAHMLPVDLDLSHKAEIPDLGLVLVIDKSGSMAEGQYGITKMDMAKEAAIRSTESLRPVDYLGVVAFDGEALWVVDTQHPEDLNSINDKILSIPATGGTNIYPGLALAYESLKNLNTKLKHVILMTDGQSMPGDYYGILDNMNREGITLSSVAVGQDADQALLKNLADLGGGRHYYTDEFVDIPKIFTKETYMATQSYIQNRTFFPVITGNSPMISGFSQGFPPLHGFIATLPKNSATMALSSDSRDPILAEWQYGLGKVVAWTSDIRGIWTEDWLSWNKAEDFWLGVISGLLPFDDESRGSIETSLTGDQGKIKVSLGGSMKESLDSQAIVMDPKGGQSTVDLRVTRPGEYEGNFEITEPGVYIINTRHKKDGEIISTLETGLAVSYSSEYDLRQSGSIDHLKRIVAESGGKILENPRDVFKENLKPVWAQIEIWPFLLPLALLLFVLDIAIRRLNIESLIGKIRPWANIKGKAKSREPKPEPVVKPDENSRGEDQRHTPESRINESGQGPLSKNQPERKSKDSGRVAKEKEGESGDSASDFTSQLLRARKGDKRRRL